MKLSQLPVGALVKDPNTKYNNDVIIWQVLEHGHTGDPSGSTTLQSRDILTLKCFDAKEPNNSNSNRKQYGNNRYKYSNILQWLNSDKNSWYEAQHTYDQEPSSSYTTYNPYVSEAGFLSNFSNGFKKLLMTVSKTVVLNTVTDGGGSETVDSKVFYLSRTETNLGNENSIAEGSVYSLYNTASNRIKNLFNTAAKGSYSEATSPWYWWLRTPSSSDPHGFYRVDESGTLAGHAAYNGSDGISPALCISSDTEVSDTPDASNVYTLQFAPACVKAYIGDENGEAKLVWEQEHEIEALVPVMTSNTTPSGEVVFISEGQGSNGAYIVFDGTTPQVTTGNVWYPSVQGSPSWIGYDFTTPKTIKRVMINNTPWWNTYRAKDIKIEASNDKTTWVSKSDTLTLAQSSDEQYFDINNSTAYRYWRVYISTSYDPTNHYFIRKAQFYGY